MNMTQKISFFVSGCAAIATAVVSCQEGAIKYPQLHNLIEETMFIDVHAHPVLGHRAYRPKTPIPRLSP